MTLGRRRSWLSPLLLCLPLEWISCDAAGLRGNEEPLWRSAPVIGGHSDGEEFPGEHGGSNNTDIQQQQQQQQALHPTTTTTTPLVCELDPLVHDEDNCDIVGTHPTTPVCLWDAATHEYETMCVPITDTATLTATLLDQQQNGAMIHPKSYCGKCHACFQTKEELQAAVTKYKSRTQIDMTLATHYGWPMGEWCLAPSLQDLSKLFGKKPKFNEDLAKWDTRYVTNMDAMFQNAYAFNQPLQDWDTSRVTSMQRMFAMAIHFDQPLNNWSVDRVSDMSYMFLHALKFNQDLSHWSVHNTFNLNSMFFGATNFQYDPLQMWATSLREHADTDNMCQWSSTTATGDSSASMADVATDTAVSTVATAQGT